MCSRRGSLPNDLQHELQREAELLNSRHLCARDGAGKCGGSTRSVAPDEKVVLEFDEEMRVREQSLALAHDGVLRDFEGRWNIRMMPTPVVHLRKLRISRHEREVAGDADGAAGFDDEISAVEAQERAIAEE
jgi:hypothetical protein